MENRTSNTAGTEALNKALVSRSLICDLKAEWQKPKAKNLKENDSRTARDYDKIALLHKSINEEKAKINGSIAERKKIAYQKELESKNALSKFLTERSKKMAEKAKIRRQKREAAQNRAN